MVAASKNWQRGKISAWPESRGGRGPWSKYKVVVGVPGGCVVPGVCGVGCGVMCGVWCGMSGVFPYMVDGKKVANGSKFN